MSLFKDRFVFHLGKRTVSDKLCYDVKCKVNEEMGSHAIKRGGNNHFSLPDHTPVIFRSSSLHVSSFFVIYLQRDGIGCGSMCFHS